MQTLPTANKHARKKASYVFQFEKENGADRTAHRLNSRNGNEFFPCAANTARREINDLHIPRHNLHLTSSPPAPHFADAFSLSLSLSLQVLDKICDHFLANHTAIVLYMTDSLNYGRHTMASQGI